MRANKETKSRKRKTNNSIIFGDYVFPIYGLRNINGKVKPFIIHGTCFSIGKHYFLTALHVVREALTSEETKIGFFEQVSKNCVNMSDYTIKEEFPEHDLAIIESDQIFLHNKKPKAFNWGKKDLLIFETVRAMGYPFGYDIVNGVSIGRGFSGTVLCSSLFQRGELNTNCYELSFQAPKGLSGGLLIDTRYNIHGVVMGNSETEINVYYDERSYENEGQRYKEIERINQKTYIGLAVKENCIFKLHSREFGSTIYEYLLSNELVK